MAYLDGTEGGESAGFVNAGLAERERQRRIKLINTNQLPQTINSFTNSAMPHPWDAFYGGMRERGATKLADDSAGVAKGMFSPSGVSKTPSMVWDPSVQSSAVDYFDPRKRMAPVRGFQTQRSPLDTPENPYGVGFGADAEIERRLRAIALSGLGTAEDQTRIASEPDYLQQQRRNIASRGTIENPADFSRRTGRELAAEELDPASPIGQKSERDFGRKLEQFHMQNVLPGILRGDANRDVAGIRAGADRDVAGIRAGATTGSADSRADSAELKALTDIINGGFASDEQVNVAWRELQRRLGILGQAFPGPVAP